MPKAKKKPKIKYNLYDGREIDWPAERRAAAVQPDTLDESARTVELTFTTGARVLRRPFFDDEFEEELEVSAGAMNLDRLNNSAPLLDTHNRESTDDQIGVVLGARIEDGGIGAALVRFFDDERSDRVFRKVKQGLRNVSIGYQISQAIREEREGQPDLVTATSWQPFEVSMVPVGADAGAGVRNLSQIPSRCLLFERANCPGSKEIQTMPKEKKTTQTVGGSVTSDPPAESTRAESSQETPPPAPPPSLSDAAAANQRDQDQIRAEAVKAERIRVTSIQNYGAQLGIENAEIQRMIDNGTPLRQACQDMLDLQAERSQEVRPFVERTPGMMEETDTRHRLMSNAILHRAVPGAYKIEDGAVEYRGRSFSELAEINLRAQGAKLRGLSKTQIIDVALNNLRAGGLHATSDFPLILADVANKELRRAYSQAPETYALIARRTTATDFKTKSSVNISAGPNLELVGEHGEYRRGSIAEVAESYGVDEYGKVIGITRRAIINDDLGAFTRIPFLLGDAAARLEGDIVWGLVTANAAMSDGFAFLSADHNNLAGAGAAISVATLGAGRAAMRKQTDPSGAATLNIPPSFLVVPAELETTADQFVRQITPEQAGNVNPFVGRLTPLAEARLDADSTTAWYLVADPNRMDGIEYAFLDGNDGPMISSQDGFDVSGVQLRVQHDFGAGVVDFRSWWKNAGA